MSEQGVYVALAGLFGAMFGSFLNVCVSRWPAGESVVAPRSRCPGCGHQIRWFENIPIVSWMALRARCAGCGAPISAQYPMVELAVALIWMAAVAWAGPSLLALRLGLYCTILLGVVLTDAMHYVIPDGFTVTGFVAGLVGAMAAVLTERAGAPFASLPDALLGACAGAGLIAIAGWMGEVMLKREAMGFGDVTLMAMIGMHLGPWRSILTVFLAAGLGLVVTLALLPFRGRFPAQASSAPRPVADDGLAAPPADGLAQDAPGPGALGLPAIPFGVYLAPASVLALVAGDLLIDWYLRFAGLA